MNKTAIKNFATWARKKLIADITYKASLMGITDQGIKSALPQSMPGEEAYDIGTKEPYVISGNAVRQRAHLARLISDREKGSDYQTAFNSVVEEVAYTWFNRLIAIRFMEVNDYMPDHIRVLSSENGSKLEPDMVTTPFDTELEFTEKEKQQIIQLKNDNAVDELFQMLFIRECNSLNQYLPRLFEKTADYSELLLNVSITDKEGVVYHLVHDIEEQDFDINNIGEDGRPTGQVEIIGWLYQYYNAELKDETFALLKKNKKITKERIPSATQLFTPDWIVRYMVENSLGRVWLNGHPNDELKKHWIYYIDEAKQEPDVEAKLLEEREEYKKLRPEDLTLMDPSMGSGHILVYGFDVLMQIYTSVGYSERDAAQSILKYNLYGLDIDERAFQLAYFAVMMKGRQYDRRILTRGIEPHVYAIEESNDINRDHLKFLGNLQDEQTREKNRKELVRLLDQFQDAKIYGSIIKVEEYDFDALREYIHLTKIESQFSIETLGVQDTINKILYALSIAKVMQCKYFASITNPPYMGNGNMDIALVSYLKQYYPDSKSDLSTVFMERCFSFVKEQGYMAMINIPVWMFISSYKELRSKFLNNATIINMLHLGRGIFGSDFGTTSFVFEKSCIPYYMAEYRKLYLVHGAVDTVEQKEKWFKEGIGRYTTSEIKILQIPRYPIAYWVSSKFTEAFQHGKLIETLGSVSEGIKTGNNDKYLRLWNEIEANKFSFGKEHEQYKWIPYHKGGDYRKWFGNNIYAINWENDGIEIRNQSNSGLQGKNMYFSPFIGYSKISAKGNPMRFYDKGMLFDSMAPSILLSSNNLYVLGLLNFVVGVYYLQVLNPTMATQVGDIKNIPVIFDNIDTVEELVKNNITISKNEWNSFETSWGFCYHPLALTRSNEMKMGKPSKISF